MLAGTANLAALRPRLPGSVRPVLEALEEQMVLLRLLGEASADRDAYARRCGSATRTSVEGLGDDLGRDRRLRRGRETRGTARRSSARPGWTTPARWPRSAPSRATSAGSWQSSDPRPAVPQITAHVPSTPAEKLTWQPTTTPSSASRATRPPRRSSAPTAGWPASCTPTSTRTRRRRSASRRSPRPTRCSPTRRSASVRPRRRPASGAAASAPARASASATSWTRSSARQAAAGPRLAARARGQDALIRLESTWREAAFGVDPRAQVDTAVVCPTCAGEGTAPGTHAVECDDLPRPRRGAAGAALLPRPGHDLAARARSAAASARVIPHPCPSAAATAGSAPAAR